jgi:Tol biopolymer transport system component
MKQWRVGVLLVSGLLAGCVIMQQTPPPGSATPRNDDGSARVPLSTATDMPLPFLATNTRLPSTGPETENVPPIVFESSRDGSYELYALYPDGTGLQQLTDSDSANSGSGSPAWSPDGSQIAFSSNRDGDWDIHVLGADGSSPINLTAVEAEDDKASWSPDGSWIAFNSRRGGARWADIWMMNADGSSPINLTRHPDDDREPAWSPNGTEIAFRSFRDGNYDLYVMDVESHAASQITETDSQVWNGAPAWSPDGAWIAFETDRDGDWNIYVMDNNGNQLRNLTPGDADDKEPTWSPDGRFLAFSSTRDGNDELYVLEIATGAVRRLTYDCGGDYNPDWRRGASPASGGEPIHQAVGYVARGTPNLRDGPGPEFDSVGGAALNECLTIIGRSEDRAWLRVRTSVGHTAWVLRDLLDIQGDLASVPVANR